jgi:uncharacterized protein with PQ loop repeat
METLEPLIAFAATAYGFVGSSSSLLQARAARRRGDAASVSVAFLCLHGGGYAIWFLYGLSIASVPILLVDGLGFLSTTVTLYVIASLRRQSRHERLAQRCSTSSVMSSSTPAATSSAVRALRVTSSRRCSRFWRTSLRIATGS